MEMKLDLTGQRFGRLTVVRYSGSDSNYRTRWECKCDCGNYKIVKTIDLTRGATRSCGCLRKEAVKNQKQMYPEDVRNKRLRYIWHGMRRRCNDSKSNYFYRYGQRGIKVCDEWNNDYVAFARWALQNGYNDHLTLDRIDNDGNYEPSNCRWITEKEQHRNTSTCRYYTHNGVTKTLIEWAEEYGIHKNTLSQRLNSGMSIDEALVAGNSHRNGRRIPIRCVDTAEEFSSISDAAKKYNANISSIAAALRTGRMSHGMKWEYVH